MHSVGREDKMEQQNLQDNTDIEIDVLELFHVLLNKFWIILLAGIIAGLAFIGGTGQQYTYSAGYADKFVSDKRLCRTDQKPYSY